MKQRKNYGRAQSRDTQRFPWQLGGIRDDGKNLLRCLDRPVPF